MTRLVGAYEDIRRCVSLKKKRHTSTKTRNISKKGGRLLSEAHKGQRVSQPAFSAHPDKDMNIITCSP